ncbi:polysaccharide pyruvyl transferase family protein [Aeromonas sp. s8]|uniref:polysaccharide pyruvyl transferase family protein n=1 Tax=Aeromonas sp. s8 TaxID=3138489 RepID=UPI0034A2805F
MKVAITGPLADKNLGDYGMFINNLYDMPIEHKYIVFSYNSAFVENLKSDFLQGYDVDFIDVQLTKETKSKFNILEELKKIRKTLLGTSRKKIPTPLELLNRCSNIRQLEREIESIDVLLVSGGGYFNDLWFEWERNGDLFKIITPILIASRMNKKVVFTANGYGPFDSSQHFYEMVFAESKNAIFGCRDKKLSPMYLSSVGVKSVEYLPDDLYIVNSKIEFGKDYSYKKYGDYVIFEQYGDVKKLKENIEKIKSLVLFLKSKKLNLVFLTFDIDEPTTTYLKENIKQDNFYIFGYDSGYLKINDAVGLIKNSKLVICNRYHALVLSLTNKVPVINVIKPVYDLRYYYNKNVGVLDNAFDGLYYDYGLFIKESISDVIEVILFDFDNLLMKQNRLYQSPEFDSNKATLADVRKAFFNRHLIG